MTNRYACCVLAITLFVVMQCHPGALGSALAATGHDNVQHLMKSCQAAAAKGDKPAEADALYNLASSYFDEHDLAQAESYMRRSLEVESELKRPQSQLQTHVALAGILVALRRNDEALAEYQKALNLSRENNLGAQAASIINNMGALSLVSHHWEQSEQLFEQARAQAAAEGNVSTQSGALVNLAVVSRARHKLDDADKQLTAAVSLLADGGDERALSSAYAELGHNQSDLGRTEEAIASYKKALQIQKGQLDDSAAAKSLLSLGQLYLTQNKFADAEACFHEADQLSQADRSQTFFIDLLVGLGGAKAGSGHFAEAEKIHQQALQVAQAAADRIKERTVLSELGYDYLSAGSPEAALTKYVAAYNLLCQQEPDNIRQKGILLTDIAMSCKAVGQLPAAIANYEVAVDYFNQAGDLASKAMALNSLAVAYLDNGMLTEFDQTYNQSKTLFASLNNKRGEAILDYNLAQYRLVQGHPADAVPLYQTAMEKINGTADSKLKGQALRGLGLAYLYLGRSGKALECYKQAQQLAEQSGDIEARWDCALGLGKAYKALGQLGEAIDYLRQAAELVEKERSQLSRDTFKTYNLDLRQDCFTSLVDALVCLQKDAEALAVAEKGRSRAFLDLLEGHRSRRPNDEYTAGTAASTINISSARIAEPGSRGVEVIPRASSFVEASTISQINAQPPTIEEIKELVVKSRSTAVEYYVLPDKVLIWIIHPDGKIEMPPPIVISKRMLTEQIVAAYKAIIARSNVPSEVRQVNETRQRKLRELYTLLVEPVLSYLPTDPDALVTIVPHGPLFSVPFAALINVKGRFMVEDHTLAYIPALGALKATQKLEEEAKTSRDQLLAFGNPITKQISFLGALPYSEKEVRHVADLFAAGQSTVKVGGDATKAAFIKLAPASTIIHLATHGLVNEEQPMDSALVLAPAGADDGLLTVKDILRLPPLKSRLIVLSACQTARGKITGDGVVGLSRSFIIAGTPSILVSQWNVDDVITEFQMVAFYKSFLAQGSKARALREAQLKTITLLEKPDPDSSPSRSSAPQLRASPRYWAAFQLIGEDR